MPGCCTSSNLNNNHNRQPPGATGAWHWDSSLFLLLFRHRTPTTTQQLYYYDQRSPFGKHDCVTSSLVIISMNTNHSAVRSGIFIHISNNEKGYNRRPRSPSCQKPKLDLPCSRVPGLSSAPRSLWGSETLGALLLR